MTRAHTPRTAGALSFAMKLALLAMIVPKVLRFRLGRDA
jgi:hypothetical protein